MILFCIISVLGRSRPLIGCRTHDDDDHHHYFSLHVFNISIVDFYTNKTRLSEMDFWTLIFSLVNAISVGIVSRSRE